MRNRTLITALIAMAVCNGSLAANTSDDEPRTATAKEGLVVVGSAVAGALLGGPIGYMAGGLTGAWLAGKVGKADELDESVASLDVAHEQIDALTTELARVDAETAALETQLLVAQDAMTRYHQLASQYVSFELMFRTGASDLVPDSEQRISQLAQFLAAQPGIGVQLSGYADPRGDENFNQALTEGRVQTIAGLLERNGVDSARITRTAFGDRNSIAPKGDLDAYALERRVTIELSMPESPTELASADH